MAQEQRFELVSMLGRGGMAEVFLGWMHSVGGIRRKVAIKRILPELIQKQSKLYQQMFADEARLAFQLEHDNIVRVYDVGQTASTFFIVMEYIEGFDLKHIMEHMRETNAIFPLGVAIYIILQVCAGLGYAHSLTDPDTGKPLGLIHNDISPPNILIGRYGEVKVSDFGLSDARSNSVETPEGMIKGKFAYISPESTINPKLVTSRSDIFSIGIVLWEMLAGRKLFQRDTDIGTFKAVKEAKIPDIRKYRDDLPPELIGIVHKALAPSPDNRYQTCEEMYHDLNAVARALSIPVNRYDLSWIVNNMAGDKWSGFVGEKVSDDLQKDLQAELGGMMPPGEAEALGDLVTGMSVASDVKANAKKEDWVKDVFDDIGFADGEVVFDKEKKTTPPPSASSSKTPAVDPKALAEASKNDPKSGSQRTPTKDSKRQNKSSVSATSGRQDYSGMLPSSKVEPKVNSIMTSKPGGSKNVTLTVGVALVSFVLGLIAALFVVMFRT